MVVTTETPAAERAEPTIPLEPSLPRAQTPKPWRRYAVLVVGLGIAALGTARLWPRVFPGAAPADVVRASGRIEGREVTLAPKSIQARVKRLLVDEGQTVKRGQLLAELEATQLDARASSLTASIAAIDAQIEQALMDVDFAQKNSNASIAAAEAGLSSARARVVRARAVLANSSADHERAVSLFNQNVVSKRELDQAEMSLRTSEADVEAAEKDVARAQAELAVARASTDTVALKRQQVRTLRQNRLAAAGQLAEAEANLAERMIVAPTDGTILSRPVEVGDVVSPGSPVFQMVDMSRLYVKVYIPEPDIPKLKLGDPAEISVDAFPHRSFPARVSKIHDQAEFTPKNVETAEERLKLVFGVELMFANPDRLLKPGMPADCVIHWTSNGSDGRRHGS